MRLDGGAVLTGINGRGKTSYLQLLPLFYGESPSEIVKVNAGKDSFIDYYLPRTTSYICFEYSRADGSLRLVVCYSTGSGEKLSYRFVRGGFNESMFKTSDTDLVTAQNLKAHLKLSGVIFADRQIETISEYRAIIQGAVFPTSDRQRQREIKQLVQDYSFSQQPLRQIEKIVTGMFRRETNFSDLQSMVVNCVSDGHAGFDSGAGSISISQDRSKIEGWTSDYNAYVAVMKLEPRMAAVEESESDLMAIDDALAEIRAKYASLKNHLEGKVVEANAALVHLTKTLHNERDQYDQARTNLRDKHGDANQAASAAEAAAAQLNKRFIDYESSEIQDKARCVDGLQDQKSNLDSLKERHGILIGESREVTERYDRLKNEDQAEFNIAKEVAMTREKELLAACDKAIERINEAQMQADDAARAEADVKRMVLDERLQSAIEEFARREVAEKSPQADPELVELLEQKREALEVARETVRLGQETLTALEKSYLTVRTHFSDQERKIGVLDRAVIEANAYMEDCKRQLNPGDGTLLRFLRDECPAAWSSSIAKVIRGDILERTDLAPSVSDYVNGVYGLSLNLDYLEAHPSADVTVAQQALERAQAAAGAATETHRLAVIELKRIGDALKEAETARDKQKRHVQTLGLTVTAADADRQAAGALVAKSKTEAHDSAKEHLRVARQARSDATAALIQHKGDTERERKSIIADFSAKKDALKAECSHDVKSILNGLTLVENSLQAKFAGYDSDRDQLLSAQGVDTSALAAIEAQIETAKTAIRNAETWARDVGYWRHWCRDEWPKHKEHVREGERLRVLQTEIAAKLQDEKEAWDIRSTELGVSITKREKELKALNGAVETAGRRISDLENRPSALTPAYDPAWTLDMLNAQANRQLHKEIDLEAAVARGVREVYEGFKGRAPKQYIEQAIPTDYPRPCREWVAPLSAWYAGAHTEYRRLLISESSMIAGEIKGFHAKMSSFHRRVNQFNRELQTGLDRSLAFESISHVGVEIISTIAEKEYWSVVEEMFQSREALSLGDSSELPSAEFAQNVERLLGFWDVKTGIRADFNSLIRIQGEVVENGNRRFFKKASDLKEVSSNGLSYLVLTTIFIGFINRIRGDSNTLNITWALDELKDLSAGNVFQLLALLKRNNITLVSAFPDPDPDTLSLFAHRYTVEPDRRLSSVIIDDDRLYTEPAALRKEFAHVQ
ncbi:ATP-binding protein [Pseudomonas sp. TMP9]|uniref:ATP-binding protein n=1 Tax=Pseudomonas sp. TMP9 TaxID=3133144 RepID=UPI0030CE6081